MTTFASYYTQSPAALDLGSSVPYDSQTHAQGQIALNTGGQVILLGTGHYHVTYGAALKGKGGRML